MVNSLASRLCASVVWRRTPVLRLFSTEQKTEGEKKLTELLQKRLPKASAIEVNDVSNGCGSMYQINVEALEFKGLTKVAQHKLITETLRKEIADMHGLVINTKVPK